MRYGGTVILLAAFFLSLLSSPVLTQEGDGLDDEDDQDVLEELEQERTQTLEEHWTEDISVRYGGWTRLSYYAIDDESSFDPLPARDTYLREIDNRLWGDLSIRDTHHFYVRLRGRWENVTPDDHVIDDIRSSVQVDQAFYNISLHRAFGSPESSFELESTLGRQLLRVGSGSVYHRVHDGIKFSGGTDRIRGQIFGANTRNNSRSLDRTDPSWEHDDRRFYGGQIEYRSIPRFKPFAYYLQQNDRNSRNTSINFDYDSEYVGLGFRSEPISHLSLTGEFVRQTGESWSHESGEDQTREDIDAYALLLKGEYNFRTRAKPRINFGYMRGSGDSDRNQPQNTLLGNQSSTDDHSFAAYGSLKTGYSLNPDLGNLQIFRLGGDVRPFESPGNPFLVPFESLTLGLNTFHFRKVKEAGGISDPRAQGESEEVGWEVDMFANWRIFSDTLLQTRFGRFWRGDAYQDSETEDFFSVHLTITY